MIYLMPGFGQADFSKVETNIEHVTVYMQGAQIMRTAAITLPPGRQEITLTGLSPFVDANSIRLSLPNCMIQSVQFEPVVRYPDVPESRIKVVRDSIRILISELEDLRTERRILEAEKSFISHNRSVIGKQGIEFENYRNTILFISERTANIERSLTDISKKVTVVNDNIQRLSSENAGLSTITGTRTGAITVIAITNSLVSTTLKVTYFVREASWFPSYEANVKDLNSPLQLTYRAHVRQSTGVDWDNVKLSVSNANPNMETSVPIFEPQIIGRSRGTRSGSADIARRTRKISGKVLDAATGEAIMFANVVVSGHNYGVQTDFDGNFSILVHPDAKQLDVSFAGYHSRTVQISQDFLTIRLQGGVSIDEIVVTEYRVPLIDLENQSNTINFDTPSDHSPLNIRGSRASSEDNYVDGLRMKRERDVSGIAATTAGVSKLEVPVEISMKEMPRGFTIDIEEPNSIPSDNRARIVVLNKKSLETMYLHVTKPRQLAEVFLTAGIINWHEHHLLPGEILLIFEDTYVGKSLLEPAISSDTLRISLGVDNAIMVNRKDVSRQSDKRLWRNRYRELRIIELSVRNNRSEEITLKLTDQIPVSQLDAIKVEPSEISEATYTENTGRLDWIVQMPPGTQHVRQFSYLVDYPTLTRLTWE